MSLSHPAYISRRVTLCALGTFALGSIQPRAAAAQSDSPLVGLLSAASERGFAPHLAMFREGLREAGFVEGRNLRLVTCWADDQPDRLQKLAIELAGLRPAVIVTAGGSQTALAAKAANANTPLVFLIGSDPVGLGLVASLNRPGGKATGLTNLGVELGKKRVELMHDLLPSANTLAWFNNPHNPNAKALRIEVEAAGRTLRREIAVFDITGANDLEPAFAVLSKRRIGALVITADPLFNNHRAQIVALAQRFSIPTMYPTRDPVASGGLVSYGSDTISAFRDIGSYAARILKGENPADLPVLQFDKLTLAINLRTARTLGITVPTSILLRADEVIE